MLAKTVRVLARGHIDQYTAVNDGYGQLLLLGGIRELERVHDREHGDRVESAHKYVYSCI